MNAVPNRAPVPDSGGPALDYTAAIAEFYREFPQHKKDVFILNPQAATTGKEAVALIAPALDDLQAANKSAMVPFSRSLGETAFMKKIPMSVNITDSPFARKAEAVIYGRIVMPAGDEFTAQKLKALFTGHSVGENSNARYPAMKEEFNNTEMWQRYVLDHELGHALTMLSINKQSMKTSSIGNRAECEADCYSMIRHYQRYGAQSEFPEFVSELRNFNAVHKGDVIHWTSPALDEVIALNKQGKLANLTPAEARDLAVDIAQRRHLSVDAEYNMQQAFAETLAVSKAAIANKTHDGDRAMNSLAKTCEIGAKTESPSVLDACQRYFKAFRVYAPTDLPQSKTPDELKKIGSDAGKMMKRKLEKEPEMDGLRRAFRDAMIDFSSGKKPGQKPATPNDNKPKAP